MGRDAGTEDGDAFSQDNAATDPQEAIKQLTKDTVPENGVFLSPDTTTVLPMARYTCALVGVQDTSSSAYTPVALVSVLAVAAASLLL
jgi:hypothetical protein